MLSSRDRALSRPCCRTFRTGQKVATRNMGTGHTAHRPTRHRNKYTTQSANSFSLPVRHSTPSASSSPTDSALTAPKQHTKAKEPTLMKLPAELLIKILEHILLEENTIHLTALTKPPGILHTHPFFHEEGRKLWYCKNQFEMDVLDCDATLVTKWCRLDSWQLKVSWRRPDLNIRLLGRPNWNNLMSWCQGVQKRGSPILRQWPLDGALSADNQHAIVAPALEMCERSWKRRESWEVCSQSLESLRRTAVAIDRRWLAGWNGQS